MELSMERGAVAINENVLSVTTEQSVESDVLLADYYPSIVRVLRCHVETSADQCVISGERLMIDGTAVCHVHYKAEDGGMAKISVKIPYSKTVDLKRAPENPIVHVEALPGYFNCRVVNPRRIDLRGAVINKCTVFSAGQQPVISGATGGEIQCRNHNGTCAQLLQWTQKSFMVRQDQELAEGMPAPARILKCTATAGETNFKVVGGKLIARCEATVKVMYCCTENKIHHANLIVPVSEIIDADGVDENCVVSVAYKICWCDVQTKDSLTLSAGAQPVVAVEMCVCANIAAARNRDCNVVTDCYCTRYEVAPEVKPVPMTRALPPVHRNITTEHELDMPPEVAEILELWADLTEYTVTPEETGARVAGKLQVCMFARQESGELEYYDHMQEFEGSVPIDEMGEKPELFAFCVMGALEFGINNNVISMKCTVCADVMAITGERKNIVVDISSDETKPVQQRNNGCLTLYYPQAGEEVWDIGKRYGTSVQRILDENNIMADEPLSGKMLLIPVVQ